MKNIFFIIIWIFTSGYSHAQYNDAPYRLFGEISTVENKTFRGFITWGGTKNYWIDFFEAIKNGNPYSHYFDKSDEVIFQDNGRSVAKPPVHIFCCRFGNIQNIRPSGENEIELQLKDGSIHTLIKGNTPDINANLKIGTSGETISIKWEKISDIHFMSADTSIGLPELSSVAGIVKSSQGKYKGLITWNSNRRNNSEKNQTINTFLNKMERIIRDKSIFKALPKKGLIKAPAILKNDILYPVENIMINMPNIGSVVVAPVQFEELEIIPLSELSLLTYDDFQAPQILKGEITTRNHETVRGNLAYDLDENLNIEVLDGKNDNISYRIPFKYIQSIEPKNYKYSYITLTNGNQLSLGDAPDVNRNNSGILVSDKDEIPVYIFWNEIKNVILEH